MKKIIVMALALAGVRGTLVAQQIITEIPQQQTTRTEAVFNSKAAPGRSDIRFDFNLPAGNRMMLEFNHISQVDSLPDIDSLLAAVWKDLQMFGGSLQSPLGNMRIDFVIHPWNKQIRILDYPQQGNIYQLTNDDATQLKMEQDTIRIRISTYRTQRDWRKGITTRFPEPYYITLLLNHATDLKALAEAAPFASVIAAWKEDLSSTRTERKKKTMFNRYYAVYSVAQQKRTYPGPTGTIVNSGKKSISVFPPYLQLGLQFANGAWSPSAGLGLEVVNRIGPTQQKHYRLIYEPLFFFDRDANKKMTVERNGFVTFKYTYYSKFTSVSREIQFTQNMSIGYLAHREGQWFDKHTIKLGLPGMQMKTLVLEPEIFMSFSSHRASPSLKLTYFFW